MSKNILAIALFGGLISASLAVTSFADWSYPEYDPSAGNQIAPPVNTGSTPQTKHGNLSLLDGSMIIDSNISTSNTSWITPTTSTTALNSDGPLGIHGALSTTAISATGYLSGSIISTLATTPTERPLCVHKSDGRIMPCTPDTTQPSTKKKQF
jgi:hypothetical protein